MEERLVPELSGETEKNKGKKEAEEGFLHEIDVNKVFIETGLDKNGLCKLLGVGGQSIDRWGEKKDNNGNRPKYNSIVRLLRAGATTETLFGVTCKPKQAAPAVPSPDFIAAHPDLLEGLQEQLIADLKKRGIFSEDNIRDIVRQEIDRLLPGKTDPKI